MVGPWLQEVELGHGERRRRSLHEFGGRWIVGSHFVIISYAPSTCETGPFWVVISNTWRVGTPNNAFFSRVWF